MFKVSPASLQIFIDEPKRLTPSFIPNSNYVTMVSEWNSLKIFLRASNSNYMAACFGQKMRHIQASALHKKIKITAVISFYIIHISV
jgi:hypothetical protein